MGSDFILKQSLTEFADDCLLGMWENKDNQDIVRWTELLIIKIAVIGKEQVWREIQSCISELLNFQYYLNYKVNCYMSGKIKLN